MTYRDGDIPETDTELYRAIDRTRRAAQGAFAGIEKWAVKLALVDMDEGAIEPTTSAIATRAREYEADGADQYRPAEGWSGPDDRGIMRFTKHGARFVDPAPGAPEGYEYFFIGRHGAEWTTYSYRPIAPTYEPGQPVRVKRDADSCYAGAPGTCVKQASSGTVVVDLDDRPGLAPIRMSFAASEIEEEDGPQS